MSRRAAKSGRRGASGNDNGFPALTMHQRESLEALGQLEDAMARIETLPKATQEGVLFQFQVDGENWMKDPKGVVEALRDWLNEEE